MITINGKVVNESSSKKILIDESYNGKALISINNCLKDVTIYIKENTTVSLVEEMTGDNQFAFNVLVGDNASVHELLLAQNISDVKHNISLGSNTYMESIHGFFSEGSFLTTINLNGAKAQMDYYSVAAKKNEKKLKINLFVNHLAPFTTGNVLNYGIVEKKSSIIYNVVNDIKKGMNGSVAMQKTRGIILSPEGHFEANPALLISEYDVKANHGATIGKISDDDLFYLMSRGISKEEAMTLITEGFLIPIVEKIELESYQEKFNELVKGS